MGRAVKKLRAAARRWVGGSPDETDQALAAFGLKRTTAPENESFGVYYFNWSAFCTFVNTWQQWRIAPNGARAGMDWAQVESALRLARVARGEWPHVFTGLRAMQDAVLMPEGAEE